MKRQILTYAVDVFSHHRVVDELALTIDISGKLTAQRYFSIE